MITIRDLLALGVKFPSRPRLSTVRIGYLTAVGITAFDTGLPLPSKRAILVHRFGTTLRPQNVVDQIVTYGLYGPNDTHGHGDYDALGPMKLASTSGATLETHSLLYDGGIYIADTSAARNLLMRGSFAAASLGPMAVDMYAEYFDLGAGGSIELLQNDGLH